jgi:endoglucanase
MTHHTPHASLLAAVQRGSVAAGTTLGPAQAETAAQAQAPTQAALALDDTARLLKALSEAPGPSAFEEEVRKIVVAEYEALGARIEYDGLGSVLATIPGATTGPRVMVTAHMDEVGLMVQHITPDGFIRVKILGGILEQALPDQRWTILGRNGPVTAVSGLRTTHVLPPLQRGVVWSLDDTFLDVGATSREEVERLGIRPGDGIAPHSEFLVMPNGRYAGKAWDDRVGLGVMIAAARRIRAEGTRIPAQVVWVATTQEEIGLRGAQTAVQGADLGISSVVCRPAIRHWPHTGTGTSAVCRDLPARQLDDSQSQAARLLLRRGAAGEDPAAAERPYGLRRGRGRDPAVRQRPPVGEHDGAHALPARPHRHHPAVGFRPRR